MSRSGYSDDFGDDDPLAMGRYRQAVQRALDGKRGQAFLRDLLETLDAMPDKRLYSGSFATAEGEFCILGAHAARKGVKVDDLGDAEDGCDTELVGQRFGIARTMAAEIMYENDEEFYHRDGDRAAERWRHMRAWVVESIRSEPHAGCKENG